MSLVTEMVTGGFLCKWKIENCSYYVENEETALFSPNFTVDMLDKTTWHLIFFLWRKGLKTEINCGLCTSDDVEKIKVNCELDIIANDGEFERSQSKSHLFSFLDPFACETFFRQKVQREDGIVSKDDTLTVCCYLWKGETKVIDSTQWFARTRICVHRRAFEWIVDGFSSLARLEKKSFVMEFSTENLSTFLTAKLFWIDPEKGLHIVIKKFTMYPQQVSTCKMAILDGEGNEVYSGRREYFFGYKDSSALDWKIGFPIMRNKLIALKDKYLVNDILSLRCEISISNGNTFDEVECIRYGRPCKSDLMSPATLSLKDGLLDLYSQSKFCDVTLRTESSSFLVHKAILCARSLVFYTMFDGDLKESRTGIVEISDLSDDTVRRMVMFMYTDIVEDLDWESAISLYDASEKYDIAALKTECCNFLMANTNFDNVTDILVLADLHQDEDMKLASLNFILENDRQVIGSDTWKMFMQENLKLAAETTHEVYKKKLFQ